MCGSTILGTDPGKRIFAQSGDAKRNSLLYTNKGGLSTLPLCVSIDFRNLPGQSHKELPSFFFFFVLSYSVWINIIIIWIEKQISNLDKIFLTLFEERRRTNKIQSGDIFFFDSRQMGKLVRSKVFVCLFLPRLFAIYTKQFP